MWSISEKLNQNIQGQIKELKDFDWKFYIKKYPDLLKNGIDTELKAKQHYIIHGIKENRENLPPQKQNKILLKIEVGEEEVLELFYVVSNIISLYKDCIIEMYLNCKNWSFLFKKFKNIVFLKNKMSFIDESYFEIFPITNLIKTPLNLMFLYKTKFNIKKLNLSQVEISEFIDNDPHLQKFNVKNKYAVLYIKTNDDIDLQKKYISIIESLHLKYKLVLIGDLNDNLNELDSYLNPLISYKKITDCRGLSKEEYSYIINNSLLYIGYYCDYAALAQILNIPSFIIYDEEFNPYTKIYRYHNTACEILNLNTSESILKFMASGFKYNWTNLLPVLNDITYQNLITLKNT